MTTQESGSEPWANQALKAVRELLEKAEDSAHKGLSRATPAVQKSLDASMEAATGALNKALGAVDGATAEDQVRLLKAYRKLLASQLEFVDSRVGALQKSPGQESQAP
jgi:hypothetical protein